MVMGGMHPRSIKRLAEFDLTLLRAFVPVADALSRAPSVHAAGWESSSNSASVADVLVVDPAATVSAPIAVSVMTSTHSPEISLEPFVRAQQDGPYCQKLASELSDDASSDSPFLFFLGGLCLRYRYVDSSGSHTPVVLPTIFQQHDQKLRRIILQFLVLSIPQKMLAILQCQFYWPRLKADARRFVLTCRVCQVPKRRGPNPRFGSLHPFEFEFPMHTVSIYVVGPISPLSANGSAPSLSLSITSPITFGCSLRQMRRVERLRRSCWIFFWHVASLFAYCQIVAQISSPLRLRSCFGSCGWRV